MEVDGVQGMRFGGSAVEVADKMGRPVDFWVGNRMSAGS